MLMLTIPLEISDVVVQDLEIFIYMLKSHWSYAATLWRFENNGFWKANNKDVPTELAVLFYSRNLQLHHLHPNVLLRQKKEMV